MSDERGILWRIRHRAELCPKLHPARERAMSAAWIAALAALLISVSGASHRPYADTQTVSPDRPAISTPFAIYLKREPCLVVAGLKHKPIDYASRNRNEFGNRQDSSQNHNKERKNSNRVFDGSYKVIALFYLATFVIVTVGGLCLVGWIDDESRKGRAEDEGYDA